MLRLPQVGRAGQQGKPAVGEFFKIVNETKDLPEPVWDYLKKEGFFSLIIPKSYGGREFSAIANSTWSSMNHRPTVKGKTAEEYLRESILDPDAYLAGNFQDGLMSREYPKVLSEQQLADVIAYLMTLK